MMLWVLCPYCGASLVPANHRRHTGRICRVFRRVQGLAARVRWLRRIA